MRHAAATLTAPIPRLPQLTDRTTRASRNGEPPEVASALTLDLPTAMRDAGLSDSQEARDVHSAYRALWQMHGMYDGPRSRWDKLRHVKVTDCKPVIEDLLSRREVGAGKVERIFAQRDLRTGRAAASHPACPSAQTRPTDTVSRTPHRGRPECPVPSHRR